MHPDPHQPRTRLHGERRGFCGVTAQDPQTNVIPLYPDRRAFEREVIEHRAALSGAAMKLTRDRADAEDLVQDVLVRSLRFWESFIPGSKMKPWLFTILRNTFINRYHREGRKRDALAKVLGEAHDVAESASTVYSESSPPGPDHALESMTQRDVIMGALECLPEHYRVAVMLRDIEGYTYQEIADLTGMPMGSVMSRLYRGRKALHAALHEYALEHHLVSEDSQPGERRTQYTRTPAEPAPQLSLFGGGRG